VIRCGVSPKTAVMIKYDNYVINVLYSTDVEWYVAELYLEYVVFDRG